MTEPAQKLDITDILSSTEALQRKAFDPAASVWVSANAGTGKTHVLTRRVLRLLLAGTAPERILCLTYTKAAAAEMSARIFRELGAWVTHDAEKLAGELRVLLGRQATAAETERARTLFAFAIETPGGLKVQTIHSFAERLLKRFPLEAGVAPGFAILDDITARSLLREATDAMLAEAAGARGSTLGEALNTAITYAVDDNFDTVLAEALSRRDFLDHVMRSEGDRGSDSVDARLSAIAREYRLAFGLAADATTEKLDQQLADVLPKSTLQRAHALLEGGNTFEAKTAEGLRAAIAARAPADAIAGLTRAFMTKQGEPKSDRSIASAKNRTESPDICTILDNARDRFARLTQERRALDVIEATVALIRLADSVLQRYAHLKAQRAGLDYDDLIRKAANLLHGPMAAPWVLYKLDGGLDHILVDESQDTSPEQWRIVEALAGEFFSGAGNHEQQPTLFAVGDEKQSIYSFQGARPEEFARMGQMFRAAAAAGNALWHDIPLHLSFRTVAPILEAVDAVFADPRRAPGLSTSNPVQHAVKRIGQSGLVEIWETEKPDPKSDDDIWAPVGDQDEPGSAGTATSSPAARLADRIARSIKAMIDGGERLLSQDRALTAGDIIILVRKRAPFAPAMVAALKAHKIPVAGADRLQLTEQLAVKDLLVLGDFLTLPEDDLALATVLKSPMFGFDDDMLLQIAHDRRGASLWKAMLERRHEHPAINRAAEQLRDWRRRADFQPPYEFLAGILDRDGVRLRMLERLGPEAADGLDELLTLAIQYDEGAPPSLTGFLAWLRQASREIKRDMDQGHDEVRILTVHGAKGLEAPIVFLPDTCTTTGVGLRSSLVELPSGRAAPGSPAAFVWTIKGARRLPLIHERLEAREAKECEERNRLLYVAMTRARDRLYISGFEGQRARPDNCWYELVNAALGDRLEQHIDRDGQPVRRMASSQASAAEKPQASLASAAVAVPHPDWAKREAPRERQPTVPIQPSRLAPYDVDEAGDPISSPPRAPGPGDEPHAAPASVLGADNRFLRGTLTHMLLQHLPDFPESLRRRAAEAYVEARGRPLRASVRRSIVEETLAVMAAPALKSLFGPTSRAEVAIRAELPHPSGHGPALKISGQIDRLAFDGDRVLIADYKTNHPAPHAVVDVADAYIYQIAAYRLALAQMFPDKALVAAIVWTDGPRLMLIPDELTEAYARQLWDPEVARLDGD